MCFLFRKRPMTAPPIPTPSMQRPLVGVCTHRVNADDIAALRAMGVTHIRQALYADNDGAQHIQAALDAGLDVIVVSYRRPEDRAADRARFPDVTWQYFNEPDWSLLSPVQAGAMTHGGDVTSGLAHGTPQAWVDTFILATEPQRIAFHIYGVPLSAAVTPTLAQFANTIGPFITEIGDLSASEVEKALRAIDGAKYPRVYVYALFSPDDGFTLTDAHKAVITKFIQGA